MLAALPADFPRDHRWRRAVPAAQEQLMQVLQPVRARQRYQGRTHLHCLFSCLGQA